MKKEDVAGLFAWIVILGGAVAYFFLAIRPHATYSYVLDNSNWFLYVLYYISAIFLGVIINSVLFELAHICGAKIGRYDVVSVNMMGFNFYKENGKTKFHFSSFDGLTGETKILPKKEAKKEPNPSSFLLFGSLFYGVEIVIIIFAFLLMKTNASNNSLLLDWAYFILTIGVVGAGILFYNIIPFRLDSLTDGYRLRLVGSRKNRKAFNNLLYAEVTGQIDKEEEEKHFKEEKETNFSTDINLNKAYMLLSEEKYNEAEVILKDIVSNKKSSKKIVANAENQIIYINIYTKSVEEAQIYYDENINMQKRREISDDSSMGAIRTYILMSGLLDKSNSECYRALEKSKRAYKRVLEQRKPLEKKLFNEALQRVINAHPNWEGLSEYIIQ